MTVGKIYAGLLIAENWKAFKANKAVGGDGSNASVVSNVHWSLQRLPQRGLIRAWH